MSVELFNVLVALVADKSAARFSRSTVYEHQPVNDVQCFRNPNLSSLCGIIVFTKRGNNYS